jgi:Na+/H+ antiporter NhaD/arsenite permease-like protein
MQFSATHIVGFIAILITLLTLVLFGEKHSISRTEPAHQQQTGSAEAGGELVEDVEEDPFAFCAVTPATPHADEHGGGAAKFDEKELGRKLPLITVLPFVLMLASISVMPLKYPEWWESNLNKAKVSVAVSIVPLLAFLIFKPEALHHPMEEYTSFIILLASLYVISGGIHLAGDVVGTPRNNLILLAIGGVIASFIGTTGAAMVLIRPVLRINKDREHVTHIFVFFIFVVANIGGCLTPLGDPPLFLGYLEGVPFFWTLNLFVPWLLTLSVLLSMFFIWDSIAFRYEKPVDHHGGQKQFAPMRLDGLYNLYFFLGVMLTVLLKYPFPLREFNLIFLAILSYIITDSSIRSRNMFNFHAIIEVAVLFIGIFITMIPALLILTARGAALGVDVPWKFFWFTGVLSAFLDNAPTYLNFLSLARGLGLPDEVAGVSHEVLKAISLGAVFMGAMTYIGNGPNFMVKSIVEGSGRRMPSFLGFLFWSVGILIPLFIFVTYVFF